MSSQHAPGTSSSSKELPDLRLRPRPPTNPQFNPSFAAPPPVYPPPPPPPFAFNPQVQQAYFNHLATWQPWAQYQQFATVPSGVLPPRPPHMFSSPPPPMHSFGALPMRPGNGGFNVRAQAFVPGAPFVFGANNTRQFSTSSESYPNVGYETPNAPAWSPTDANANTNAYVNTNAYGNTNANASASNYTPVTGRKKNGEPKIMIPAPKPSPDYLAQAMLEPHVVCPPDQKLVILDLNGTLLHRPNRKQPTKMVGRPFLNEFLQYLFSNFAVMVWSSARPQNVKVLVENGLGELQHQLVGRWARDSFGLSAFHYDRNVQVYKNLDLVWESSAIQRKIEGYEEGKRFDQRNTILIDDTSLKAAAQPYNLLEVPEFVGEPTQQDILAEVAGYLELVKMQDDVSKFVHQTAFKADGTWSAKWSDLLPAEAVSQPAEPESNALVPVVIGG